MCLSGYNELHMNPNEICKSSENVIFVSPCFQKLVKTVQALPLLPLYFFFFFLHKRYVRTTATRMWSFRSRHQLLHPKTEVSKEKAAIALNEHGDFD